MKNITLTELEGKDVHFDQTIDSDSVVAAAGGVAVNGNVEDSALNTGINTGIMAGDDVKLDDSIVGRGNTQINDSDVGAFAGRGDATNAVGENVNLGSGDLTDVDTKFGDAQVVTGHANEVTGDVTTDVSHADGPINVAVGDDNDQQALEDNSTNIEDSFKLDKSVDGSFNEATKIDAALNFEDNDSSQHVTEGSFNTEVDKSYYDSTEVDYSVTDSSSYHESSEWKADFDKEMAHLDDWGTDDLDLD